jgi:DNA/RNA endonuclease YhcR with UshA esterase domain
MKNILSLVLAGFLVLTHVHGEEVAVLPVVTPQEAAAQEGKQVKVKGVVDGQKTSAKGITYLNFGGRFPNHVFSCVLRSKDFPDGVPSYEGKEVEVTGLIKMYEGKPSMDIKSMDQIHVTSGDAAGAVSTPSASPTGETER